VNETARATRPWWGEFEIPEGGCGHWRIGPLRLWISRSAQEWRIAHERGDDPLESELAVELPGATPPPAEQMNTRRYGFKRTKGRLGLLPALADRPVIIDPVLPFAIPPREELTLYISSAVWVQVRVGEPPLLLQEEPAHRPSDTWFGPSTREGEMAYAGKTGARHDLENLPRRPHRVISAVRVRNRAADQLDLAKLKLPAPHMSIYGDDEGNLWTQTVTLERSEQGEMAELQLGKGPSPQAVRPRLLQGPRVQPGKGLLIRAFGGVFGGGD
jgi:hypothetical protein